MNFRNVWKQHGRRYLKFALVGLVGTGVNLGIFTVMLRIGLTVYPADIAGIIAGSINNYALNYAWGVIKE
jgi:putative flippase GtrA